MGRYINLSPIVLSLKIPNSQDNINTISFILRFNLLQIVSLTSQAAPPLSLLFFTFPHLFPFLYILTFVNIYIKNSAFHDFKRSQERKRKVLKTYSLNFIKINCTFFHIFTKLKLSKFFFKFCKDLLINFASIY